MTFRELLRDLRDLLICIVALSMLVGCSSTAPRTVVPPPLPPAQKPARPSLMAPNDLTNLASVLLSWDINNDPAVIGYQIYVGTNSGAYGISLDMGNTNYAHINGLQPGVTYYFAATDYDTNRLESAFSNEISYTPPTLPPGPTNYLLSVTVQQSSDTVSWTAVTNLPALLITNTAWAPALFFRAVMSINPQ